MQREVRRHRVARIAIGPNGRAQGVELDDGSVIRAKRVISNAHPITTYLDLIGRDHLPWLEAEVGDLGLDVLAAVKNAIDPRGILNPGKLIG